MAKRHPASVKLPKKDDLQRRVCLCCSWCFCGAVTDVAQKPNAQPDWLVANGKTQTQPITLRKMNRTLLTAAMTHIFACRNEKHKVQKQCKYYIYLMNRNLTSSFIRIIGCLISFFSKLPILAEEGSETFGHANIFFVCAKTSLWPPNWHVQRSGPLVHPLLPLPSPIPPLPTTSQLLLLRLCQRAVGKWVFNGFRPSEAQS